MRTLLAALAALALTGVSAPGATRALLPVRYIPASTVKRAVFAHLTGQKLGKTYSQQRTKLYTALDITDQNFGMFYLFITAKGVPVHRFSLKSGPYNVRYPARRRVIVASHVYDSLFGPACQLVEVYGANVALAYTADAPHRRCPVRNPPRAFRRLDQILRSLPGA